MTRTDKFFLLVLLLVSLLLPPFLSGVHEWSRQAEGPIRGAEPTTPTVHWWRSPTPRPPSQPARVVLTRTPRAPEPTQFYILEMPTRVIPTLAWLDEADARAWFIERYGVDPRQ